MVNIYSLKIDSWRTINELKRGFPIVFFGKFVNGKLYWASSADAANYDVCNIISLDLTYETWGKLELPNYGEGDSRLIG